MMKNKTDKLLSIADISAKAELTRQRVLQIIQTGTLKAEKVGGSYIVRESDFDEWNLSRNREAGRPKKSESEN